MASTSSPDHSPVRADILAVGQRIMASKGYSAVGINEILGSAGVPKGSFYHYFGSKDAFGQAMLDAYFAQYLTEMEDTLGRPDRAAAERLMAYFEGWREGQSLSECQGRCLAVKLGAEVADLSEAMRDAMQRGTSGIVARLAQTIAEGQADRSLAALTPPAELAESLYQLWLGASVLAKVARHPRPFDAALATTRQLLQPTH
jgi:TetR/AcrR family transcriptional repressor of nem operon